MHATRIARCKPYITSYTCRYTYISSDLRCGMSSTTKYKCIWFFSKLIKDFYASTLYVRTYTADCIIDNCFLTMHAPILCEWIKLWTLSHLLQVLNTKVTSQLGKLTLLFEVHVVVLLWQIYGYYLVYYWLLIHLFMCIIEIRGYLCPNVPWSWYNCDNCVQW